jgi:hypothetical protein
LVEYITSGVRVPVLLTLTKPIISPTPSMLSALIALNGLRTITPSTRMCARSMELATILDMVPARYALATITVIFRIVNTLDTVIIVRAGTSEVASCVALATPLFACVS